MNILLFHFMNFFFISFIKLIIYFLLYKEEKSFFFMFINFTP